MDHADASRPADAAHGTPDVGASADDSTDAGTTPAASVSPAPVFTELPGPVCAPVSARPAGDLAAAAYVETEFVMSGTAHAYRATHTPPDGRFVLVPVDAAAYATRVLVRRPEHAHDFSGVAVVEWLNVSSGQDAAPDLTYLGAEILRRGHAWVGLSAQYVGVHGGADSIDGLTDPGLRGLVQGHPERFGHLTHPGDAYSFDLLTTLAGALRETRSTGAPLGPLTATSVIGVGESQGAYALTSYLNGVQPLTGALDAALVHSRGAGRLRFDDRGSGAPLDSLFDSPPARIRDDLDIPVLVVETEGDLGGVMRFLDVRQPDTASLRVWEIAGTAHADRFQIGEFEAILGCADAVNSGQQAFVLRAALRALSRWVEAGTPAPQAPPIEMDGETIRRDSSGNALGGVRTPAVEAPVDTLLGDAPGASVICALFGRTLIRPPDAQPRWEGREHYLQAYEEATDRLVEAGFLLTEDRAEILADARPDRI